MHAVPNYIQRIVAIYMIKKNTNLGININRHKISMLRFANNIALIAENKKDLVQLIKSMDETFNKELDMRINVKKTKVLVYGR